MDRSCKTTRCSGVGVLSAPAKLVSWQPKRVLVAQDWHSSEDSGRRDVHHTSAGTLLVSVAARGAFTAGAVVLLLYSTCALATLGCNNCQTKPVPPLQPSLHVHVDRYSKTTHLYPSHVCGVPAQDTSLAPCCPPLHPSRQHRRYQTPPGRGNPKPPPSPQQPSAQTPAATCLGRTMRVL